MPSRILGHGVAREQRLQRLRHVLRGEAERAGAVLIDLEADRFDLLAPVEMRIDHLGVLRHDGAHLLGDARAPSCGSGPTTRNCTGKPTGGPKLKRSTRARASGSAPSASARSSRALTRSRAVEVLRVTITIWAKFGLGSTGLSPSQKRGEPWPDIGRVGDDVGIAGQQLFGAAGGGVGDADGGAFGQPQLEEQLGAGRGREELLLHEAEARDRSDEHQRP